MPSAPSKTFRLDKTTAVRAATTLVAGLKPDGGAGSKISMHVRLCATKRARACAERPVEAEQQFPGPRSVLLVCPGLEKKYLQVLELAQDRVVAARVGAKAAAEPHAGEARRKRARRDSCTANREGVRDDDPKAGRRAALVDILGEAAVLQLESLTVWGLDTLRRRCATRKKAHDSIDGIERFECALIHQQCRRQARELLPRKIQWQELVEEPEAKDSVVFLENVLASCTRATLRVEPKELTGVATVGQVGCSVAMVVANCASLCKSLKEAVGETGVASVRLEAIGSPALFLFTQTQ